MKSAEDILVNAVVDPADPGEAAVGLARAALADTLALGIGGLGEPAALAVSRVLPAVVDGQPDWLGRGSYGLADLALLHGTACHALDADDYMHPMHGHCSAVLLPAAWSIAAHEHRSGVDLLDAYLVGYRVNHLVSLVLSHGHYRRGWHATSTIGVIGAAAAAARLLGLDTDETSSALGIAASGASGLQVNFGTPTKALHAGLAARTGVIAALLAREGLTAHRNWLTGMHGMLAVLGGDVTADDAFAVVTAGAAGPHGITGPMGLVQKPWSSCGCSHAAVDATIAAAHGIDIDQIEAIEVHVDPAVVRTMRESEPSDGWSARYSVSWVVAVAAADGAAGPAQFSEASLAREDVRALRRRVRVMDDLAAGDDDRFAAHVVVRTPDGVRENEVRFASGHPRNPMSDAQRVDKMRRTLEGRVPNIDSAIDLVLGVTDAHDVGAVYSL